MITHFEFKAVMLMLVVAVVAPRLGLWCLGWIDRVIDQIGRRRTASIVLVGMVPLITSVSLGLLIHCPQPAVHDEFAYLLTADTFAEGRLTNASHRLWEHFETYHVIQQPTYQAKYFPAQGAVLAGGQVLAGYPIVGVWLSVAAACAATCWMLYGWVPPRWALLGGLITAVSPGVLVHWGQTYWGGAVAMTGGALVFGALPRVMRSQRTIDSVWLGLGWVILANSRPYEGLVASVPAVAVLGYWLWRRGRPGWDVIGWRVILPLLLVVVPALAWMGYYNFRVTGDPLRLPYQAWSDSKGLSLLDTALLPAAHDATVTDHSQETSAGDRSYRYAERAAVYKSVWRKTVKQYIFYFRLACGIPLLALPWMVRTSRMRFAITTTALTLVAVVYQATAGHPHYLAPVTALLIVITVQGLRHLRQWGCRGRFVSTAIPLVSVASLLFYIAASWAPHPHRGEWSLDRARFLEELKSESGEHLVMVRYRPEHSCHEEWVYNRAAIDRAKVVWARELDDERNRQLWQYFQHRRVWLIAVDEQPRKLVPYPEAGTPRQARTSLASPVSGVAP